jgi:hypothetical protein
MGPKFLWSCSQISPPVPSWARRIQSATSHLISLKNILMLSFYLRQCLPSDLFRLGLPTKTLYAYLISLTHPTFPAHLLWFEHPSNIWWTVYMFQPLIGNDLRYTNVLLLIFYKRKRRPILFSSELKFLSYIREGIQLEYGAAFRTLWLAFMWLLSTSNRMLK